MEPINNALKPVSEQLPAQVRDFLEAGGWLGVFAVLLLLVLLILLALGRSLFRRPKPRQEHRQHELDENLADYPEPLASDSNQTLMIKRTPVRLRLVVLAEG